MLNDVLPVAEHFHSPQGEGLYTGTPMHFIRLAGCSVGRHPDMPDVREEMRGTDFPILKTERPAWLCHTYDGRPFWCDTDFSLHKKILVDDLLDQTWERYICLTGGEPLNYDLTYLVHEAYKRGIQVNIETSGTILLDLFHGCPVWVAVSPKVNYLPEMIRRASEIKLLVDQYFDLEKVPKEIHDHPLVYVQPINDEMSVRGDNVQLCLDILRKRPTWRISTQLHKVWGVR
jgi:7-carboxy-7-deazaguanine synthase